uniref:F-box domain-containing protein n=2 Tax=Caenorhabditis tropicalis TaxID=1561998 RepID=A0A1I7UT93_9PELO
MSFPLLRLPCLALEEIVKNFNHDEILNLAQTSRRAKRSISKHTKMHFIRIFFYDASISYFQILHDNLPILRIHIYDQFSQKKRAISWKQAIRLVDGTMVCAWKREVQDFQEILDFLNEIFRIEKVSFTVDSEDPHFAMLLMEHVVSKNLKIGRVDWQELIRTREMAERLLTVSKGATDLKIKGLQFLFFCFDHFNLFRMDQLRIEEAAWITAEQVVALRNCKRVSLGDIWFGEESINKILLEYMKNPGQLQELRMCFNCVIRIKRAMTGLNNLEVVEGDDGSESKYWLITDNGIRFSVTKERSATVVIKRET